MKKVSIIIPVYNGEQYIERCINSILNQSYKNIEIICLNDGSKDKTLNLLKTIKDKRLIVIDKKNTGVSDTRNLGIKKSTGDYIAFCDADDFYEPYYIEEMVNIIEQEKVDAVRCNYKVIDNKNNLKETGDLHELDGKKIDKEEIKTKLIPKMLYGTIPCFIYLLLVKREIIKKITFPTDIHMMEDVVFYINLMMELKNIYITDKKLYTIMFNMDGATNSYKNCERNIMNIIDVNTYVIDILKEKSLLKKENHQLLCLSHINSITDFLVKYYIYDKKKALQLCYKLSENKKFINMINKIKMQNLIFQRRIIISNIKNKTITRLNFWLKIRKVIFKIRRFK